MAKRRCIFTISLTLVAFLLLCGSAATANAQEKKSFPIQNIPPFDAQMLVRDRTDLVVVDVRTEKERSRAAIPGSIHLEMSEIFRGNYALQQDTPVLLYCAVGGRSYAAAKWLRGRGFLEIYNLDGGIEAWQKNGFDVTQGE
jgi:rhodanese-related sulfurtransferase